MNLDGIDSEKFSLGDTVKSNHSINPGITDFTLPKSLGDVVNSIRGN